MTEIKLSLTQANVLELAIDRKDGWIDTAKIILNGGAKKKVLDSLTRKGLIQLIDKNYYLTEAGWQAMGFDPQTLEEAGGAGEQTDRVILPPKPPKQKRTGTKQALLIEMLEKPEGSTLDEIIEATNWQKHSVRGYISTLKKKLGLNIESFKNSAGARTFRIISSATAE